ncbi:ATP-binding sensor histidine kinase [Vacuolonema iberomarrocanum]|uniref:ATP-binding sensor histidine kinase n=1 Tax=Vacuolonema iberomarrocanum TaxID=3454632 RepID=UPI0019D86A8A|nr:PAS domain S-box protein [filamentous cyanobacterium LEGE 07170]
MTRPANRPDPSPVDLPGYTCVEPIYQGSRTIVYRAMQIESQRPVVIKMLRQAYPSFRELVQFRNQYTIAKDLPISGIIHPLRLEQFGNAQVLVMEDWGGISLGKYSQQKPLDVSEVLAIALQLADILHDLHQHRVIHKDIKPANILIHPESKQVKLIDFSIASLLPKESQEIQSPNTLEGTLAYLAPEQTGRMNRGIDYRVDYYALGITLYQLLTGRLPFVADDPLELLHCHIAKVASPTNQVNPAVPPMLGAITAKLMAKNAEDRYQSALGLKHDLEQCSIQWQATGAIASFELGQRDLSDRFLIPEKLYGREAEVQTLLEAFECVAKGASELMLIAGFSGIGKTAVVNEVHKPIVKQHGYFIKGKFDQFNRNLPLSAFVQTLQDLLGQLLTEDDESLAQWKAQILEAVGENGQILIEVIPELEHIIGQQPPVPELSGSATQNRFNLLFQTFIEVFTTPKHPLVIFLDDLQWADAASLQLVELLMDGRGYLLLLGTYRDNEVSPAHPLILTVEKLKKAQAIVNTITLAPLRLEDTTRLVADTLICSLELARPLAKLIDRKTQGNPFFITQFLKALHSEGYITFNTPLGYWECDIAQIAVLSLTDNAVTFMAQQLQKLPSDTQEILKLAACIGNQFDLATVAIVSEQSLTDTAAALWRALQEGLILPLSQSYKLFQDIEHVETEDIINPRYRFLHDRVQQAAYSLIADDHKSVMHWHIGNLLWQGWSAQQENKIFDLVNQLNLGQSVISQPEQKQQLAQLNLQAAQKAKLSAAYKSAQTYCETGIALLPKEAWETSYDLMYALHYHASEAAYLSSQFDQAENLYNVALQHARTPLEQAALYRVQMTQYQLQGRNAEAIAIQRKSTQLLGWSMPTGPNEIQNSLDAEITTVNQFLEQQTAASILELPKMTDANTEELLRILQILFYAAWLDGQLTLAFLALAKMTTLSLQHGNSEMSPFGYVGYGIVANAILNDTTQGYQFGSMAVQLCEQFNNADVRGMTNFLFAADVHSWKRPLREVDQYYENAYKYSMDAGNWLTVSFTMMLGGSDRLTYGKNLEELYSLAQAHAEFLQQIKSLENLDALKVGVLQPIRQLLGLTPSSTSFDDDHFSEAQYLQKYQNTPYHLAWFYSVKIRHAYLFDQIAYYPDLIPNVDIIESTIPTHAKLPSTIFYVVLMHLALIEEVRDDAQQKLHWQAIQPLEDKLEQWQKDCPENIEHKCMLIRAEKARLQGQIAVAIDFYEQSIAQAHVQGYDYESALANELAAKFYLGWGKEKVAAGYMQEAYYGYAKWGAQAKVVDLEARYSNLLAPILLQQNNALSTTDTLFTPPALPIDQTPSTHNSSGDTSISAALDLATVLKASQTLSSEIELNNLLATLLNTVLEIAGADKVVLLMPQGEEWFVEAVATLNHPARLESTLLADSPEIPHPLINIVKRTQQPVVIADAATHTLATDAYVVRQQPQSVLCTPILRQGKLVALLYLENKVTVAAFTRDRVELLNLLCTQAAISLENARLYQQEQEKSICLAESEKRLQLLIQQTPIAVLEWNQDFDCQFWNPAAEKMFGYRAVEIVGRHLGCLIPEDHHAYVDDVVDQILTQQGGSHAINENLTKDGQRITCEWFNAPTFNAQGEVCGGVSMTLDISDRKAAEAALVESERYHRSLFESSSIGLLLCKMDGYLVYANPAFADILGRTVAELPALSYWDITPKKYAEAEQRQLQSMETTGRYGPYEKEYIHKDGHLIPVRLSGVVVERHGEKFIWSSIEDISDRKQVEAALVESENYHRGLFEHSTIGLLLCSMSGEFLYANKAYADILGRTQAELPALSYWDITPRKYTEAEQRQLESLATTRRYGPYEKEFMHKDGHLIPVRLSGVLVERHGKPCIWSSIEDISDHKAAEKLIHEKNAVLERTLDQLQQSQAQVVKSEKMSALGNLVAGVAHEINNPIGFLNGSIKNTKDYVQDILKHLALYQQHHPNAAEPVEENAEEIDLEFLKEDLLRLIDSMEGATKRIKNISTSLRTFSRADTDHKVSANLHDGLNSTLLILKYRLKANEHRPAIEVVKDYGDIPTVECFPGQLNQVFMNILANAIDALDEANQNRSFAEIQANPSRITIRTTLEHQQVKVAIADNGLGISDEVKARIFDHLFTTKGVGKGTGLGLAIAHQIVVETHGGSLEVESAEGQGALFSIHLPI